MWNSILENFILGLILENFSDIGIKVGESWDTNSKLAMLDCKLFTNGEFYTLT